jgi:hypothetical protein
MVSGDHMRHFFQRLLAPLLVDLGERCALAVSQPHTARDLSAQDAILCHQVLVAQQQFLINSPRDRGQ